MQLLSLTAAHEKKCVLVILPTSKDFSPWLAILDTLQDTLARLQIQVSVLPHLSLWGADRFVNPSVHKTQRLQALYMLQQDDFKSIVLTTLAGLGQTTIHPAQFTKFTKQVSVGSEYDQDLLIQELTSAGYRQSSIVDNEGLFSVRGSIMDVFPPHETDPIRIEFRGDELISIRSFHLEDQKSRTAMNSAIFTPATEILVPASERKICIQRTYEYLVEQTNLKQSERDGFMADLTQNRHTQSLDVLAPIFHGQHSTGFNFIPNDAYAIYPKGLPQAIGAYRDFIDTTQSQFHRDQEQGRITATPELHFLSQLNANKHLESFNHSLEFGNALRKTDVDQVAFKSEKLFEFPTPGAVGAARFDQWMTIISTLTHEDRASVLILCASHEQEDRIIALLKHRNIAVKPHKSALFEVLTKKIPHSEVLIDQGELSDAIWLADEQLLIVPEHAIFGHAPKKTRSAARKLKNYLSSFTDLKVGDLVVHILHGIGCYRGMLTMDIAGITGDFLHLEYAAGDKIYLPVDRLSQLQKYSSGADSDHLPHVDRLGSGIWEKKKARVKQAAKDMASQLLKLQAQRNITKPTVFHPANDDYFQFEAEFPYEETEDQIKAIADVNHDLESFEKPMDRLICGDVGFGKTEIALRAAYRTVLEGFQVLVLVPTTILSHQHFRTFSDRMAQHGVRVAHINRFVAAKLAKSTLNDVASGKIDILVGTHRLLSKDVKMKRLGLLIIDEEQRFGVSHKEKLKELAAGSAVLTMTATPIPRTLHMAMLGLRDISIIATPPINRLSIKTFVSNFDKNLVADAIAHEISRGGQVFYVHNRVDDIGETTLFVKSLVPSANVRFAHGQMKDIELENVILDFLEQRFDVLVCTTIIESGVDMPAVNTLIVDDADKFGLAQLYQIRGRVGRSSQQAYAYFLTKHPEQLTDDARKRLDVIATHQELGAGFQIASHDLEIRGAGNLLGAEQSGHAADVGLEMYTDLLGEVIAELQGTMPERPKIDCEIKLPVKALFPSTYIPTESSRLQFYKSLFSCDTPNDIDSLKSDLIDRFGPLPQESDDLFEIAKLKLTLSACGATQLTENQKAYMFEVKFGSLNEAQIDKLSQVARNFPTRFRLSPEYKLFVYWDETFAGMKYQKANPSTILRYLNEVVLPLSSDWEPS